MVPARQTKVDEKLLGRVNRLADMVEYQEGTVVSRTIVDRETGTVTLFAFAEGQGLSEHMAPFDALVCMLEGKVRITISGKPFELDAGDAIILPAKKPHALQAISRFKMMLTMIRA